VRRMRQAALLLLLAAPAAALAHEGHNHEIGWTLSPLVAAPLVFVASIYAACLTCLVHPPLLPPSSKRRRGE
jgi:hypothetical protein